MFELRWVKADVHHVPVAADYYADGAIFAYWKLQYRTFGQHFGGDTMRPLWSEWRDVPTETEGGPK